MKKRLSQLLLILFTFLIFSGCVTTGEHIDLSNITFPYMETEHEWNTKNSDAPFVYLLANNSVRAFEDNSYLEDIQMVIKIQGEDGKKMGEFPLFYDSSRERIELIQAHVQDPDGQIFGYSRIHTHKAQSDYAIYTDNMVKIITLPNVQIGSIIKIRYKVNHFEPAVKNEFYKAFTFTFPYPVKYVRRSLKVPKDLPLTIKYSNSDIKPEVIDNENSIEYTWEAEYREKIEGEEFMPHYSDLSEQVSISSFTGWESLSSYAWSLFEKNLHGSPEITSAVKEITSGYENKKDQVQAVIEYIQDNFRYVSMNIDYHNYEPHSTEKIFYNKYGDCKDQTLLAMMMLKEIGVKAYPALMSTNSDLDLREDLTPMLSHFNHVILGVEFENKINYTDVLLQGQKFWEPPLSWTGSNVLLLTPEGDTFKQVPVESSETLKTYFTQKTSLSNDGSAEGKFTIEFDRLTSSSLRNSIKNLPESDREKWLSTITSQFVPGGTISDSRIANLESKYENLRVEISYAHKTWAESINGMLVFGLGPAPRDANFSAKNRQNPILIRRDGGFDIKYEYIIPEGYEVLSLPQDISIETDFAYFNRSYSVENNIVTEKLTSGTKRSYIPAERYEEIKKYYDDLVTITNNRVVIKKKS